MVVEMKKISATTMVEGKGSFLKRWLKLKGCLKETDLSYKGGLK
jgi:hypothetical protein